MVPVIESWLAAFKACALLAELSVQPQIYLYSDGHESVKTGNDDVRKKGKLHRKRSN